MFTAACVGPCLRWAARGRGLAGRARNAARGLGPPGPGQRGRSRPACCEVALARRCRARRTAVGRGWLSGCALLQAAGCTGRALRRWSADAMRRRDPACKRRKAVLLPDAHRQLRIRVGVCRQQLQQGSLGFAPHGCDLLAGELRRHGRYGQLSSSADPSRSWRRAQLRSSADGTYSSPSSPARSSRSAWASLPFA
jgi:hypothetical protein